MDDSTIIGVSVFRAVFCPDDSHFMGFVVKGDELWADVPDEHLLTTLSAEERLEVTRHPTDNPNEVALKLPCTLAQLKRFLDWAGYGDLDDADVADLETFTEGRVMDVPEPSKNGQRGAGSEEKDTTSIKRLKKIALVSKHESHWPTIDDDLRHYDENGLRECAKLQEHGYWDETAALKWAEEHGRLTDVSENKPAPTGLVSVIHKMKH